MNVSCHFDEASPAISKAGLPPLHPQGLCHFPYDKPQGQMVTTGDWNSLPRTVARNPSYGLSFMMPF